MLRNVRELLPNESYIYNSNIILFIKKNNNNNNNYIYFEQAKYHLVATRAHQLEIFQRVQCLDLH